MKTFLFFAVLSTNLMAASNNLVESKVFDIELSHENVHQTKFGSFCGSLTPNSKRSEVTITLKDLDSWTLYKHHNELSAAACNEIGEPSRINVEDVVPRVSRTESFTVIRSVSEEQGAERDDHGVVVCATYKVESLEMSVARADKTGFIKFSDSRVGDVKFHPLSFCH